MTTEMAQAAAEGYRSGCQIARRVSEEWAATNVFCAACDSDRVLPTRANTKAIDFRCPNCSSGYQLKAGRKWSERRVPDAGYAAMMSAIASDNVPNLLVLQYTPQWRVYNLLLVPSFLFSASAIEKRRPLSATARRAGWIGCNILLGALPDLGKVRIVDAGNIIKPHAVREQYQRLRPLANVLPEIRGWTLDVLRTIQSLNRSNFMLADVYAFDKNLGELHPNNQNIRAKIRQQLQVLRDFDIISFLGNGRYALRN